MSIPFVAHGSFSVEELFLFHYLLRLYLKWVLWNVSFLGTAQLSGAERLGPKSYVST